ncbi:MAG: hypothetical protein AB1925_15680 [Actinomycetota bacterium]
MGTIDFDNARARMQHLRQQLATDLAAINDNRSYSPEGKRSETIKAKAAAQAQADAWRDELVSARDSEQLRLERHAFGIQPGTDPRSYRDAVDRVEQMQRDPSKMSAALNTAIRSNDTELIRVIAAYAHSKNWTPVLNEASRHLEPSAAMLIDDLRSLPSEADVKSMHIIPQASAGMDASYSERLAMRNAAAAAERAPAAADA